MPMISKKKYLTLSLALLAAVVLVAAIQRRAGGPDGETPRPVALERFKNGTDIFISPHRLHELLGREKLVILDGNHPKLYASEHIPGAINIGFMGLSQSEGKPGDPGWGTILPRRRLEAKLASLGIEENSLVVCYSDTLKGPGAGGRAAWQLRMAGLTRVKLLHGGMELWRKMGYELTDELPDITPVARMHLPAYRESDRADREYIRNNLGSLPLLDVRSREEYSGADTSRGESRGGHIKTAAWLEWKALLRPDATPKDPDEIRRLLAARGIYPGDDFVVY